MRYSVRMIDREFSPKEAAEISKVSSTLQRDWRRRKILPERASEGWSAFKVADVVSLSVIKNLSDCGFPLETARDISSLSILPVLGYLSRFDRNYEFDGLELSDDQKARIRHGSVRGDFDRFLHMPLPAKAEAFGNARRGDLLENLFDDLPGSGYALVIDHYAVADDIMAAVKGPLFRVEVEEITT